MMTLIMIGKGMGKGFLPTLEGVANLFELLTENLVAGLLFTVLAYLTYTPYVIWKNRKAKPLQTKEDDEYFVLVTNKQE